MDESLAADGLHPLASFTGSKLLLRNMFKALNRQSLQELCTKPQPGKRVSEWYTFEAMCAYLLVEPEEETQQLGDEERKKEGHGEEASQEGPSPGVWVDHAYRFMLHACENFFGACLLR